MTPSPGVPSPLPVHPRFDVAVVGLGPAGRALAHRCIVRGLRVVAVDPHPDAPWRPTYGVWEDELPAWLPGGVIARRVRRPAVRAGETVRHVDRTYAVVDNRRLRAALPLDGADVRPVRARRLTRFTVVLPDASAVGARWVVDARGPVWGPASPEQTAYGVLVDEARATAVLGDEEAFFMDWTRPAGPEPPQRPSFLYAVPVGGGRVLLEETCLAGLPPIPVRELRSRLIARLATRGIGIAEGDGFETVRFPLHDGRHGHRTHPPPGARTGRRGLQRFGARGGLMHPATGYSVGAALRAADSAAAALAAGAGIDEALWPVGARIVRDLRLRGARVVTALPEPQLRGFFDAFFSLPARHERAYLSQRRRPGPVVAAMLAVFVRLPGPVRMRVLRDTLTRP